MEEEAGGAFITGLRWVPRGVAAAEPRTELASPEAAAALYAQMKEARAALKASAPSEGGVPLPPDALSSAEEDLLDESDDMDDDDDEAEAEAAVEPGQASPRGAASAGPAAASPARANRSSVEEEFAKGFTGSHLFTVLDSDLKYAGRKEPLLREDFENDSDFHDEDEALHFRPDDSPLIACSTDRESTVLEVYTYNHAEGTFHLHHDLHLGQPPLAIESLRYGALGAAGAEGAPGASPVMGNFAALGYYGSPAIELWDLDTVDVMEPFAVLGAGSLKRKGAASGGARTEGHSDAVMALTVNPFNGQILASGSADETVRVWDVTVPKSLITLGHHSGKVQALAWNPHDDQVLASAGYDRCVAVVDLRSPESIVVGCLKSDAEALTWNRHAEHELWVAEESGRITVWDVRAMRGVSLGRTSPKKDRRAAKAALETAAPPRCELGCATPPGKRAKNPTTCVTDSATPGLFVSGSFRGTASVWDARGPVPELVYERDLSAGPVHAAHANPDEPTVFAFAATAVVVWDVADSNGVNARFGLPLIEADVS